MVPKMIEILYKKHSYENVINEQEQMGKKTSTIFLKTFPTK